MNTSRWMKIAALAGGLLAAGCSGDVSVHVACVSTAAPAVECEVEERVGKLEVEVCWDFAITCANGGVVKAERTCQKVKDGGKARVVIPVEKLTGFDTCGGEGAPRAEVTNITLNGKPQAQPAK